MASYKIGSIVKGQVTGIEKYGAFVKFDNDYTGLIHISEISNDYVNKIEDFIKVDDQVYCQILDVNDKDKQLKLSIKNINYKPLNEGKVKESRLGFLPLKMNLDKWINDKISEIKKKS